MLMSVLIGNRRRAQQTPRENSPSNDYRMLSGDVNTCFLDEFETSSRGAWQEETFQLPVGQPPGVLDMDSVDIFERRDRIRDFAWKHGMGKMKEHRRVEHIGI